MIIDAKSIILTLLIIMAACYGGLHVIRKFALQIAQENHDAIKAMDAEEDELRLKKQKQADAAADTAYAKVKPILTQEKVTTPSQSATTTPAKGGGDIV